MNVSSQRATSAFTARPVASRPSAPAQGSQGSAPPPPPASAGAAGEAGSGRHAALARFDGFADALRDRVDMAGKSLEGMDAKRLGEARDFIEGGLERLRNGFADGTLDPADMERGVGNLFAAAAEIMREETTESDSIGTTGASEAAPDQDQAEDTALADVMRRRMASLVDHVLERADGAGYPDAQREVAAQEATALFEQAASRLEQAVFEPGDGQPIDRAGLTQFFQASFSALQGQILSLLGGDEGQTGSATTYGPGAGAEAMNTPRGLVDFQG